MAKGMQDIYKIHWAWWVMPRTPTFRKLRQVSRLEFKANLDYSVRAFIRKQNKRDRQTDIKTDPWHFSALMASK